MNDQQDEYKEKRRIYERTRDDLLARQMKNSESYDRAILSLSSGALVLSLSFIKDVVQPGHGHAYALLIVSWALFGASILLTLVSYLISQQGIGLQLEYAKKYYLDGDESYESKQNYYGYTTVIFGYFSGLFFIAAFICTILFVSVNLHNV